MWSLILHCYWRYLCGGYGLGKPWKPPHPKTPWQRYKVSTERWLYRLDTRLYYDGRMVRTKKGRVRSKYERHVTTILEEADIYYIYEKILAQYKDPPASRLSKLFMGLLCWLLTLIPTWWCLQGLCLKITKTLFKKSGWIFLRPDFCLIVRIGFRIRIIYLEVWGLSGANRPSYDLTKHRKEKLYRKNGLPLLSLEARDVQSLASLRRVWPKIFATMDFA